MSTQDERLRDARLSAGYETAEAAAQAMGVKAASYRHHENGINGLSRVGRRYAEFFRVRYEWLMTGAGAMREERRDTIRIEGMVGAGSAVDWSHDEKAYGKVARLPFGDAAVGFIVQGDSQYPRFMDGEVILTERDASVPASLIGHYAVVQTSDGRRLIKILRRNPTGGDLFRLESHNAPPEDNVDVMIAWRFLGVLPSADGEIRPRPHGRLK